MRPGNVTLAANRLDWRSSRDTVYTYSIHKRGQVNQSVGDLKIRPLHRRRRGRRKRVEVLNQQELAELLEVDLAHLRNRLDELQTAFPDQRTQPQSDKGAENG